MDIPFESTTNIQLEDVKYVYVEIHTSNAILERTDLFALVWCSKILLQTKAWFFSVSVSGIVHLIKVRLAGPFI